jgi:hypothetical protein
MSVIKFMALVIILAFAIGLFVAALIWIISWIISPKKNEKSISGLLKINSAAKK